MQVVRNDGLLRGRRGNLQNPSDGDIFPKTPKERVLGIPAGSDGGLVLSFRSLDDRSPVRVVSVAVGGTQKTVFWRGAAGGSVDRFRWKLAIDGLFGAPRSAPTSTSCSKTTSGAGTAHSHRRVEGRPRGHRGRPPRAGPRAQVPGRARLYARLLPLLGRSALEVMTAATPLVWRPGPRRSFGMATYTSGISSYRNLLIPQYLLSFPLPSYLSHTPTLSGSCARAPRSKRPSGVTIR